MKILVILGHPDSQSFNAEIFHQYVAQLDPTHEVRTLELGKLSFDPVLRFGYRERMPLNEDITQSQELLKWAEKIIFIYPIWWSSMPSLFKGWLDRVLTPGFAYSYKSLGSTGNLAGRTAELWLTSNAPAFYYRFLSPIPLRLMKRNILGLCGIKTTTIKILGDAEHCTPQKRAAWLRKIALHAKAL